MQIKEHSKTIVYTGLATVGVALAYLGYKYFSRRAPATEVKTEQTGQLTPEL